MSDLINLAWAVVLLMGAVISWSDLVVRRWEASGWSLAIALCGSVAFLVHLPNVVLP